MALSGDTTWLNGLTGREIITRAFAKIGELDAGDAPSAAEEAAALISLNAIIKEWTAEGAGLWMRNDCYVLLKQGKPNYKLGLTTGTSGTDDDFHFFGGGDLVYGVLSADAVATDTVLAVTDWLDNNGQASNTDPVAGPPADKVCIRLDNGGLHCANVSASTPTTVTIDTVGGIPSAASTGRNVYTYTSILQKPTRILSVHRVDTSGNSAPLEAVTREEYEDLSQRLGSGDPVKYHYQHRGFPISDLLYVWPVTNSLSVDRLRISAEFYMDNINTVNTDNFTLPDEYANALIWSLAHELSYEYGTDRQTRLEVGAIAERKKWNLLNGWNREQASLRIAPEVYPR